MWQETQGILPDIDGHYTVILGLLHPDGLPPELFTSEGAQWLGVSIDGQPEASRVLLVSVPYAYKALDSEALGGHSASEFVLSDQLATLLKGQLTPAGIVKPTAIPITSERVTASPLALAPAAQGSAATFVDNNQSQVLLIQQQGTGYAVYATSLAAHAVAGVNLRDAGGIGIYGTSTGNGTGVLGEMSVTAGVSYGVRGKTQSTSGVGVFGNSLATSGTGTGVRGENHSPTGVAGVFDTVQGGKILSGTTAGSQKIAIDSSGNVTSSGMITANSFTGSGVGLTGVNAAFLNGLPPSSFLTSINVGNGLLKDSQSGAISLDTAFTDSRYLPVSGGTLSGTLNSPGANFSGLVSMTDAGLQASGVATATQSFSSHALQYIASVFNSSTAAAQSTAFAWSAVPVGNNTSAPSAMLSLQYAQSGATPANTGLSVNADGTINFAPNQSFSATNVNATGTVSAQSFSGSGASLTNVNAALLNGFPASSFLNGINTGTGLLKDPNNGVISLDTSYTDLRYLTLNGGTVNGTLSAREANFTGGLTLSANTAANPAFGFSSSPLQQTASVFNSATAAPESRSFAWMAKPVANNSANPSAKLSLQYGVAGDTPIDTGLSINPDGTINFVNTQAITQIASVVSNSVMVGDPSGSSGEGGFIRDDLDSVHSITGQAGSNYHFRLSRGTPDAVGGMPDFLITPYKFGMAMEYNGVLEFWVEQFSIHNHCVACGGAQLWVGDDSDTGGLWSTARIASLADTGSVTLAADKFDHTSHGSLSLTTRNPTDSVIFTNGPFGADVPIAQVHTVRDATHNLASVESTNGNVTGAMMSDANSNAVLFGSRSAHPVQLITGDTNVGLTLFNDGKVSIGNSQDVASLAVGSSAQFQVSSAGGATIGGGTPILKHISATALLNFDTVAGASCAVQTIVALGASDGDTVAIGVPNSMGSVDGLTWFAWVSTADTVSVRACNVTAAPASIPADNLRADVWKH
ncbi:MAG: beta strand repeat-containing protein [Terriglobales bacterium]